MTPDEAIRDLIEERERLKRCDQDDRPPFVAIQLGIEALEAYQELRGCTAIDVEDIGRLPSETGENK